MKIWEKTDAVNSKMIAECAYNQVAGNISDKAVLSLVILQIILKRLTRFRIFHIFDVDLISVAAVDDVVL